MVLEPNMTSAVPFASDYVQALTDEIASFIASLPARATVYRGADLRYALQRALYFRFVNDDGTQRRWQATRASRGWLASEVAGAMNAPREALLTLPRALNDARLGSRFRRLSQAAPPVPANGGLLFAVVHPKFARYVQSIELGPDAGRFYCGVDEELHAALAAAGTRALLAPTLAPPRRLADGRQPHLRLFRLQRLLDAHLATLARERPRAAVVVEGNAPADEVLNQACKLMRIPCVCIQQGWSPIIHAGFRDFSFTTMFVWGSEFGRLLAPHNPQQRFVATGSHVIGPLEAAATGRPPPRTAVSFFLQGRSPMIDETAWNGFLELVRRVAARCATVPMLVREHPSSPLDEPTRARLRALANVELIDPATTPLQDQLARSRVGVSMFSTTLFESVANGVVPVAVNPRILRTFVPSLASYHVGVEASGYEEAEAAIVRLCDDASDYDAHRAQQSAFAQAFFNGATRTEAKAALRAELSRL